MQTCSIVRRGRVFLYLPPSLEVKGPRPSSGTQRTTTDFQAYPVVRAEWKRALGMTFPFRFVVSRCGKFTRTHYP